VMPPGRLVKRSTKAPDKKSKFMRRSNSVLSKLIKKPRNGGRSSLGDFSGETLSESISGISSSGTDTDWELASISPQFTLPCDSSDESAGKSTLLEFLPSANDFLAGFFESPNELQQPFLGMETFTPPQDLEPFFPVEQERLLTKFERSEMYDLISSGISWSNGSDWFSDSSSPFDSSGFQTSLDLRMQNHTNTATSGLQAGKTCINSVEDAHSDGQAWLPGDLDLCQTILDIHGSNSSRNDSHDSLGYLESCFGPVPSGRTGMTGDSYHQTLSSQNRSSFNSVACVRQVSPLILSL
jgi:hypothetical protein